MLRALMVKYGQLDFEYEVDQIILSNVINNFTNYRFSFVFQILLMDDIDLITCHSPLNLFHCIVYVESNKIQIIPEGKKRDFLVIIV
jgi:hypothetical protein